MPRTSKKEEEAIESLLSTWIRKQVEKITKKEVKKELEKAKKDRDKPSDYAHIQELKIMVFLSPTCPICKKFLSLYDKKLSKLGEEIKLDPAFFEYDKRYAWSKALAYDHMEIYEELYTNYLIAKGMEIEGFPAFVIRVKLKNGISKTKIIEGLQGDIVKTVKKYLISLKRYYKAPLTTKPTQEAQIKQVISEAIKSELAKKSKRTKK